MKLRSNPFAAISIALLSATSLPAATLYWDGTDTTADADGGAGNWDTVLTNWDDAATAGNSVAWPSSGTDNDAVFGGIAGTATIAAGGVLANDLTFNTAAYVIDGASLTLNGAANILSATPNSNNVANISAPITSTTGLTRTGNGTLTLSGDNSALAGTITVSQPPTANNNGGLVLSGPTSTGTVSTFNVNGSAVGTEGGGFLGLANGATIASTAVVNLSGQGGNSAPPGTLRATAGSATVNGTVNLLTSNIRISSSGGTGSEMRVNGQITDGGAGYGISFRFCDGNGVYLTNTSNTWTGDIAHGQGVLRADPGAIPALSLIKVAQSASGWFQTSGTFTRPLGNTPATNAIDMGSNAANKIVGIAARGADLEVNFGGSGADVVWGSTPGFNPAIFGLNNSTSDSAITLLNPLDLNGAARNIQVDANVAKLQGTLKNSGATAASLRKLGAGRLVHDPGAVYTLSLAGINSGGGTLELTSGSYTVTGSAGTAQPDGTNGFIVARGGTFHLNGASVTCTSGSFVFPAGNTGGGASNFLLDSGTFDAGTREALNAYGATGTTTINGGQFTCGIFRVAQATGSVNLNGGTLRTNRFTTGGGTSTIRFNGGTVLARAAESALVATAISNAWVQSGGAVIDTSTFTIAIPRELTEDPSSTGGGLTKRGTGILDLTAAANSYTGENLIQNGVLRIADTAQLGTIGAVVTVNGGQFGVSGTAIPSITSLGRTFNYITGGFHVGDAAHTLDVDINLTGSAALSKSGPGVITLSGDNDFTGGISMGSGVNGWIEVDEATDLGTGIKIANMSSSTGGSTGGIRLLNNVTVSDVALNLGGRNVDATTQHALLNVSGNNTWAGDINVVNAGGTYYLRSDSGQLELSGILSNAQPANLTADTRAFNLEGPGDFLISGTIIDGANENRFTGLVMEGTGTATLTGANTYTGSTSVKTGTLALVGGNQASPITVESDATLGFTLGSPTTSTSTVAFVGATAKVKVTGTPVAATLMTASNITGIPVLDPAIPGFELAIEGGGTLLNLKAAGAGDNYNTWAATNGVPGQAANLDHDNDGASNGVEYFIGGPTGNTTGFTALPGVTTTAGVRSITWTKAATYTGAYNTDFTVETSNTLASGSWITEASPGTVTISGNDVTYTFPAGPVKNFARLKVTGP